MAPGRPVRVPSSEESGATGAEQKGRSEATARGSPAGLPDIAAARAPTPRQSRPEAVQFLADLAANNERGRFQPRKAEFEQLRSVGRLDLFSVLGDRIEGDAVYFLMFDMNWFV